MAEWSARRTRNPAVLGSSTALDTSWICFTVVRSEILLSACNRIVSHSSNGRFLNLFVA